MLTGGRSVHSGSLGSFGCALRVVFILCSWVRSGATWGSLGSFGFVRVQPWDRWVHSCLLGSFKFALGVGDFVRGHSGSPSGSLSL